MSELQNEIKRLESQRVRFLNIIETTFKDDSDRVTKLLELYNDYGDRLLEAPASSKRHYHNAYSGGYIDHVLHVHDNALRMSKTLKSAGGTIDFTLSECVMAALHHDLWKLGMPSGQPYYVVQDSDWHRKRGEVFTHNENLPYMKVTDGALFVLQQRGIKLTHNEWLAIKLSDGVYDEASKAYLMNHGKFPIHTNLPYVIHWADHMSTVVERDEIRTDFINNITNE